MKIRLDIYHQIINSTKQQTVHRVLKKFHFSSNLKFDTLINDAYLQSNQCLNYNTERPRNDTQIFRIYYLLIILKLSLFKLESKYTYQKTYSL